MLKQAIFFDLDGTLYRDSVIAAKFAEAAYHTYASFNECSIEESSNIVEDRRNTLSREKGNQVPYTLTLLSLGIPMEVWHATNIDYFNPSDYLAVNDDLRNCLMDLKKNYLLAVITNNNQVQCERMLEAIGIRSLFDKLFTYNTFKLLKPDLEFFKKASTTINVPVKKCVMIGDRYNIDLAPAKSLGMKIFEVHGPDDICQLAKNLRSKEEV